jgi:hypothetical protein
VQHSISQPLPNRKPEGVTMLKFVLFVALAIATLATITVFATREKGRKYDYWASSETVIPRLQLYRVAHPQSMAAKLP